MFADLHLHTHFSDGTFSPEEVAERAKKAGLSALALTDHDTVDGCQRMEAACLEKGIEFIPGCEFTVEQGGNELHLLGYCFNLKNVHLQATLRKYQEVRRNRVHEMVVRLNGQGIPLKVERVLELADCEAPGRPHVGRALVEGGHCYTLDEAFRRYLKKGRPAWAPKAKMSAAEAINMIHVAGGVAVMAHPGITRMNEVIPDLVAVGLDGLECFYTRHSTSMTEHYLMCAERHGLLVTGGSDCHGDSKGEPLVGRVKLPYEFVEKLKSAAAAMV